MPKLAALIPAPVLRSYMRYLKLFIIILILVSILGIAFGHYGGYSLSYLLLGSLASALYIGLEFAFMGVGIVALYERVRRKQVYSTVWIMLGILNALIVCSVYIGVTSWADRATNYMFTNTNTENFSVALREQLSSDGWGIWLALVRAACIMGAAVFAGFYISCRAYRCNMPPSSSKV